MSVAIFWSTLILRPKPLIGWREQDVGGVKCVYGVYFCETFLSLIFEETWQEKVNTILG